MKKTLWFDIETTGLKPDWDDIIQLAYLLEIDGIIEEEGNLRMQPVNDMLIEMGELGTDIHGISKEALQKYPSPMSQFEEFVKMLDRNIVKFNKHDKAAPGGYNVFAFDYSFLYRWPKKLGKKFNRPKIEKYGLGSYFDHCVQDPLPILNVLIHLGVMPRPENRKLATVCELFGITFEAHDALADIRATRKLYYAVVEKMLYEGKALLGEHLRR